MRTTIPLGLIAGGALVFGFASCGSDDAVRSAPCADAGTSVTDAPTNVQDAPIGDAPDPRCMTQPVMLTTHPHSPAQATEIARDLIDVRGWNGRLYFAYGDVADNTGPIVVSSYEPNAKSWQDHLTFHTERIERFLPIGDKLFAPAADPRGAEDPEYASGTKDHTWTETSITPAAYGSPWHVTDAIERVPGEVLLTGSAWTSETSGVMGGTVWRSVDGGPFEKIFPTADDAGTYQNTAFYPFVGAALNGTAYVTNVGPGWSWDGTTWTNGTGFNDFFRPVTFANHIVYAGAGELFAFDGTKRRRLEVRLIDPGRTYQFIVEPLAIFQATEGHLIAVTADATVMATTDLTKWSCIGKAPADVRSIGSLGGKVYFGGAAGRIYGYDSPSW